MAKVTGGLFSLDSSGSIAKTLTMSKWRGVKYVRQTVIPANPNTTAQQSTRGAFRVSTQIWKLGSSLFVAPWNRQAQGQPKLGLNIFTGQFVRDNRGQADLSNMVFSPGAKGGLPADAMILTPAANQITAALTPPTPPEGWTLQAAVASAIADGVPDTLTDFTSVTAEDVSDPYEVILSGLSASTLYVVGGWLRWLKPDGSIAYGASITQTATTPA